MIKDTPQRCMISPLGFNYGLEEETSKNRHDGKPKKMYVYYEDQEACDRERKQRYAFFADLDRNASDSKCFIHDHWEERIVGKSKIKIRVGKCRITGKEIRVEPLQPGEVSGQPKECIEHFELLDKYKC